MKRALLAAMTALGFASAGCTALTAQDPTTIYCVVSPGDPDPCPDGMRCVDQICTSMSGCQETDPCNGVDDDCDATIDEGALTAPACTSGVCIDGLCRTECVAEICDNMDNDCDGTVDNGLSIDGDADGYLACNPTMLSLTDCDDGNDAIHPMAPERCNGFDDDCNGGTAESAMGVCGSDETCTTVGTERAPRCVNRDDCLDFNPCEGSMVCDEATARCCMPGAPGCMPIGDCRSTPGVCGSDRCLEDDTGVFACGPPRGAGEGCRADTDCATDRCYPYASLGLAPPGGTTTTGICALPCCDLAGCAGQNGTVCWAPGTGARACVPPAMLGDAAPEYELCDAFNDDCGVNYCAARSVRTVGGGGGAAYTCGPPFGDSDIACVVNADCVTGFCTNFTCRYPCADDATCRETFSGAFICLDPSASPACSFYSSGGGRLAACGCRAGGDAGASCTSNSDCRDGYCVPGTNVCASTCCSDASCSGSMRCMPVQTGTTWAMHCLPGPGPG